MGRIKHYGEPTWHPCTRHSLREVGKADGKRNKGQVCEQEVSSGEEKSLGQLLDRNLNPNVWTSRFLHTCRLCGCMAMKSASAEGCPNPQLIQSTWRLMRRVRLECRLMSILQIYAIWMLCRFFQKLNWIMYRNHITVLQKYVVQTMEVITCTLLLRSLGFVSWSYSLTPSVWKSSGDVGVWTGKQQE